MPTKPLSASRRSPALKLAAFFAAACLTQSAAAMGRKPEDAGAEDTLIQTLKENAQLAIQAPEFPADADWLNVARPLTMQDLRGRIVLLDFWTFCCINCLHTLPRLKELEEKYPDTLTVIGVHSAKFSNESQTPNIRANVQRYGIGHPVINDSRLALWEAYGTRAWPTLTLIDPQGFVLLQLSGEGNEKTIDRAIAWVAVEHAKDKTLAPKPIPLQRETVKNQGKLLFPGKLLAADGKIYVSDSGHNQIRVISLEGRILQTIGSGQAGFKDGSFSEAAFSLPQGLAYDGKRLYVADTNNHAVRAIDLEHQTVSTLAGTGSQAPTLQSLKEQPGIATPLNSPWDLALANNRLYIAMAGAHQIWSINLQNNAVGLLAGDGREALRDGTLAAASFAQPSGITADDTGNLYVADSESSAVRKIDLAAGRVETLIGKGLFDFGDRDGSWAEAALQHPLGILWHNGALFLADSYNHKIKRLLLSSQSIESLPLEGLSEPAGMTIDGDGLYIANTNAHAIERFSLSSQTLAPLALSD